jgi:AAA+ ATPase superfamily predicted ATPase
MLPPERRLPDLRDLVEAKQFFVIHAPRQSGKRTLVLALAERLRAAQRFSKMSR